MATAISPPTPSMSSSSSSEPYSPRGVRFDDECVLIPELQRVKRPIIITKTYSLPLWKRRASDDDQTEESSPVFKVPIPNFKSKTTRSSSHGRDPTSPLSPCLVHRSPSSTVDGLPRRKLERRPSLPLSPNLGKPHSTIPLRSCCPDCVTITEECLKEGAAWVEKFTRGARRRRNSSTDSDSGFAPVSLHQGHNDAAVVRLGTSLSINVDEVDKRRRSREFVVNDPPPHTSPSPPLVSSAIIEEDEDQLFPLPSPRRSPNSSPANSAAPSPNASTSQLASSESSKVPEEGILGKSLGRKGRCENGLLMPDAEAETTLATTVHAPPVEDVPIASSSPTFVDSPPSSPVSSRSKSHSRSPERRRPKERRPSFGSSVLRATGDMLKGVNLSSSGPMASGGISV
ncbi:hypothetical protein BDP27DRAFT_642210 [Rhodocollybia butyracea]|uniref:Uncharacterized protein n=1 Tax=Rhodocollybia butyracea TaxID=206335 RepID=A0A9P5PXR5_9AGAR|nr:hypothetical protein BDP27DRAFT_642210 [Rhodocollybia butyracea]